MEQGRIAACHAFDEPRPAPPEFFPYGIYSVPEISTVGMTEEEVRERGIPYECGVARFRETSRGHIMGLSSGFHEDDLRDRDAAAAGRPHRRRGGHGAHPHRPGGGESRGQLDYFVENTFNYPTLAEAYKIAALDAWNRLPKRQPSTVVAAARLEEARRSLG